MKPRFILIAAALVSACTLQSPERPLSFLGDPAPVNAATQTIVIRPDTKWVNVTGGDIVQFIVGDKSFAWAFNVAVGVNSFDLRRVAPPGVLDHPVEAYIAPDPKYIGANFDDVSGIR